MDKTELRRELLARRCDLNDNLRDEYDAQIFDRLKAVVTQLKGEILSLYSSFRGEVRAENFCDDFLELKYSLAFPKVIGGQAGSLSFFEYKGPDHMVPGFADIPEPDEHCPKVYPDIIIAPLLGFDENCNRLGYGAGHHDKTFEKFKKAGHMFTVIGLAYDFQKVDSLPCEPHDYPLDYVVTEKSVYARSKESLVTV